MQRKPNRSFPNSFSSNKKPIVGILPIVFFLLVGISTAFIYIRDFLEEEPKAYTSEIVAAKVEEFKEETPINPSIMYGKLKEFLLDDKKNNGYVPAWEIADGGVRELPQLRSEFYTLEDQVLLLKIFIGQDQQKSAEKLIQNLERDFYDPSGYLKNFIVSPSTTEIGKEEPLYQTLVDSLEQPYREQKQGGSLRATLEYIDALALFHARWPRKNMDKVIYELGDFLLEEQTKNHGFWPEVIITPDVEPEYLYLTEEEQKKRQTLQADKNQDFKAISLASIHLPALKAISDLDSKYAILKEAAEKILNVALISEKIPFYPEIFVPETSEYIYTQKNDNTIQLLDALKVILFKAELGEVEQETIRWLKERLYNDRSLFTGYDIFSGEAASEAEVQSAYGLVLQIARRIDDSGLYNQTLICLSTHFASLQINPLRYTIYFYDLKSKRYGLEPKANLQTILGMG